MTERAQHTTNGRHGLRGAAAKAALPAVALVLIATGHGAAQASGSDAGAKLYTTLCASCHGVAGHGDGPAAAALTPPPADLTKLELNVSELMRIIDGRRTVRAHGSAAMPVWGQVFEEALADSSRTHRDSLRQVQMLAEHVRSLEKK